VVIKSPAHFFGESMLRHEILDRRVASDPEPRVQSPRSYEVVHVALGAVLLIAAGLKAQAVFASAVSAHAFLTSPRLRLRTIGEKSRWRFWLLSHRTRCVFPSIATRMFAPFVAHTEWQFRIPEWLRRA
jgi:hypothetical protein